MLRSLKLILNFVSIIANMLDSFDICIFVGAHIGLFDSDFQTFHEISFGIFLVFRTVQSRASSIYTSIYLHIYNSHFNF